MAVAAGTGGAVLDACHDVATHVEVHRIPSRAVQPVRALGQLGAQGVAFLARLRERFRFRVNRVRTGLRIRGGKLGVALAELGNSEGAEVSSTREGNEFSWTLPWSYGEVFGTFGIGWGGRERTLTRRGLHKPDGRGSLPQASLRPMRVAVSEGV